MNHHFTNIHQASGQRPKAKHSVRCSRFYSHEVRHLLGMGRCSEVRGKGLRAHIVLYIIGWEWWENYEFRVKEIEYGVFVKHISDGNAEWSEIPEVKASRSHRAMETKKKIMFGGSRAPGSLVGSTEIRLGSTEFWNEWVSNRNKRPRKVQSCVAKIKAKEEGISSWAPPTSFSQLY